MRSPERIEPTLAESCRNCAERINRRRAMLNIGVAGLMPSILAAETDPASSPPQEGDVLVAVSDKTPRVLRPEDIATGAPPTQAWPMNQGGNIVRKQNRLNQLLLIKLDPAALNADTRSNSVDGVLAFSALCTHAGCILTDWIPSRDVLACDCHSSEFDPRDAGKVVDGPAAHPLPQLPLKLVGGNLVVAKPFAVAIRFDE